MEQLHPRAREVKDYEGSGFKIQKDYRQEGVLHHLSEMGDQAPGDLLEHTSPQWQETLLLYTSLQRAFHENPRA